MEDISDRKPGLVILLVGLSAYKIHPRDLLLFFLDALPSDKFCYSTLETDVKLTPKLIIHRNASCTSYFPL